MSDTNSSAGAKSATSTRARSGAKPLVIVESPAKAKIIAGFLGPDFIVEASIGHIRDLPRSAADIQSHIGHKPGPSSVSTSTTVSRRST